MSKAKVMVVEDEKVISLTIQHILENLEYTVVGPYASGEKALEDFELKTPDVVLMDINLEGVLDGIETAKKINENHSVPILFVTAYSDEETLKRARITGPFGYLIKPFKTKELVNAIEIALYKHEIDQKIRALNDHLEERVEERTRELQETNEKLKAEMENTIAAQKKLQEMEEFRVNFLRSISHEIKTPLNILYGNIQLFEMGVFGNSDTFSKPLKSMKEAIKRAMDLVEKLLALSRAESGALQVQLEAIDFSVLETVIAQYRTLAEQKHLDFSFQFTGVTPFLGDVNLWSSILSNLLSNAVKFCQQGTVQGIFHVDADWITFTVSDSGTGISEEFKSKIFLPFFTNHGAFSGTGLGLAMVKKMVEMMDGRITFQNNEEKGATFRVVVPQVELIEEAGDQNGENSTGGR